MLSPMTDSHKILIAANLEHDPRRGRVLFAGELLTAAEARAIAEVLNGRRLGERLARAADELEQLLEAG